MGKSRILLDGDRLMGLSGEPGRLIFLSEPVHAALLAFAERYTWQATYVNGTESSGVEIGYRVLDELIGNNMQPLIDKLEEIRAEMAASRGTLATVGQFLDPFDDLALNVAQIATRVHEGNTSINSMFAPPFGAYYGILQGILDNMPDGGAPSAWDQVDIDLLIAALEAIRLESTVNVTVAQPGNAYPTNTLGIGVAGTKGGKSVDYGDQTSETIITDEIFFPTPISPPVLIEDRFGTVPLSSRSATWRGFGTGWDTKPEEHLLENMFLDTDGNLRTQSDRDWYQYVYGGNVAPSRVVGIFNHLAGNFSGHLPRTGVGLMGSRQVILDDQFTIVDELPVGVMAYIDYNSGKLRMVQRVTEINGAGTTDYMVAEQEMAPGVAVGGTYGNETYFLIDLVRVNSVSDGLLSVNDEYRVELWQYDTTYWRLSSVAGLTGFIQRPVTPVQYRAYGFSHWSADKFWAIRVEE